MGDYGPPLDRLLNGMAEPDFGESWPDYLALGFDSRHVPELIRMATDPVLNGPDTGVPEAYAPLHAWRTLGQLRAESAAEPLSRMMADLKVDHVDDWATAELPVVLGMIGPPAVPFVRAILDDESVTDEARFDATGALSEIGRRHPEARDECVAALSARLEQAGAIDPTVNGFVVSALMELDAKEAAGVLERAFQAGFVDDTIAGSWYDVWLDLELEGEPPPRPESRRLADWDDIDPRDAPDEDGPPLIWDLPPDPPQPHPGWEPAVTRTPEERKNRNKALRKLEKKKKGKGGKKR